MRVQLCFVAAALSVTLGAAPAPPAQRPPADKAPTVSDIRDAFDQGEYPRVLQLATRALAAKGEAARGYDRYELLALKGETQLRMKQAPAAAQSFDDAAKAAADEKAAALARAMAELARRSKNLLYTPPATKDAPAPNPIDVTDRSQRITAFTAMFQESRPRFAAVAEAARRGTELPPMLDALRKLWDLRSIEIAATESDAESKQLGAELAEKARSVMDRAVKEMADTVAELESSASQIYEDVRPAAGSAYVADSNYMGLSKDGVRTLRQVAADCDRIAAVAVDLKAMAPPDQGDALRTLRDDAAAVASRAREVGKAYGRVRHQSGYGAGPSSPGYGPDRQLSDNWRRGGTTSVQRPAKRGNDAAGPRGVDTSGRNR